MLSRSIHSDEREVDLSLRGQGKLNPAAVNSALNERTNEGLKLRAEELEVDVFGSRSVHSNEREVDLGLRGRGKLDFGLLSCLPNALYCHGAAGETETGVFLEFCEDVFDKGNVEIFAAKVGVAVGRLDLKNTTLELEDRDVERSTTQIVDSHNVFSGLVHTVGKGSGSGFVDDTEHVQSSDFSGVLGCLSLSIVEVSRNGDDSVVDFLPEVLFSGFLHLDKYHGRELLRRVSDRGWHARAHGLRELSPDSHDAADGDLKSKGMRTKDEFLHETLERPGTEFP